MKKIISAAIALLLIMNIVPATVVAAESPYAPPFDTRIKAAYMVNLETGTVIYEKNSHEKVYPASLTKMMTAIVAYENIKDIHGETVTAPGYIFDEFVGISISTAGISRGETLTVKDLLACLLIPSAGEAASIIADYVSGGDIPKFIDMMNEKAKEIGAVDTHFVNPHGLYDDDQYTTAYDMYLIGNYFRQIPELFELSCASRYTVPATNKYEQRILVNTNYTMDPVNGGSTYYYEPIRGLKTGSLPEAGRCLVSTATKNGFSYMIAALGAPEADEKGNALANYSFIDSISLYKWAFDTFTIKPITKIDSPASQINVKLSWNTDHVLLAPATDFSYLLPKDIDASSVQLIPHVEEEVNAPVEKGQVLGTASLMLAGEEIGTVDLVAMEAVERSEVLYYLDVLKRTFNHTWVKVALIAVAVLIIFYMVVAVLLNKKSRKQKNVRRKKRL